MTPANLRRYRLFNQQIGTTAFTTPQQLVQWMAAMQAQDVAMAKWAIGLRLQGISAAIIEKAFNEGVILRTHVLRPTWHFVAPADIRWLLALTAPRVHAISAYYYRKGELDNKIFTRAHKVLEKALQGHQYLTRSALQAALANAKIVAEGHRLSYIMMHAELEGLICSGPRQGKQFTYALLEERVPPVKKISRETALAALAERYFTSRAPATVHDFAYWSGLTLKDAGNGADSLPGKFIREEMNGQQYILAPVQSNKRSLQTTFLMPDYDEYGMSYKDRSTIVASDQQVILLPPVDKAAQHAVVVDGVICGTWQQFVKGKVINIKTNLSATFNATQQRAVQKAIDSYRSFMLNTVD